MNYAIFKQWTLDRVEDLVSFGVPREEAEALMIAVESGATSAEAAERSDNQFLLDFKRVGAVALAERKGCSPAAIRKKRRNLIRKQGLRARLRSLA